MQVLACVRYKCSTFSCCMESFLVESVAVSKNEPVDSIIHKVMNRVRESSAELLTCDPNTVKLNVTYLALKPWGGRIG